MLQLKDREKRVALEQILQEKRADTARLLGMLLPPHVVEVIVMNPTANALRQFNDVVLLYSDLKGFTVMTQMLGPGVCARAMA